MCIYLFVYLLVFIHFSSKYIIAKATFLFSAQYLHFISAFINKTLFVIVLVFNNTSDSKQSHAFVALAWLERHLFPDIVYTR